MRLKPALLAAALAAATMAPAQSPRQDFKRDIRLSASNLLAYPGPDASKKLTPAPDSLKPFYISHYGRHGSRFLIDPADYDGPLATLRRADSLGKLTLRGRDALRRIMPKEVMLYSLDRPTPAKNLTKIEYGELDRIAARVRALGIATQVTK